MTGRKGGQKTRMRRIRACNNMKQRKRANRQKQTGVDRNNLERKRQDERHLYSYDLYRHANLRPLVYLVEPLDIKKTNNLLIF